MARKKRNHLYNSQFEEFFDSQILNDLTFNDFFHRLKRICLSIFEWINIPNSMNSHFLEETLFYEGWAAILNDKNYGFINTKCSSSGNLNIYNQPITMNCYSFNYNTFRKVFISNKGLSQAQIENNIYNHCILVYNDLEHLPTYQTVMLFAQRLTDIQRTIDININAQKTPLMLLGNEQQRLLIENLWAKYKGNSPMILGYKKTMNDIDIKVLDTKAEFLADKLTQEKKEIFNEFLTYIGVNNIVLEKKERLISDEANSNNELININLQAFFKPRQEACKKFNEKYQITNPDEQLQVKLSSDLHNIIKQTHSIIVGGENFE